MTTPDHLREAARVLRERAEAATPGPWSAHRLSENVTTSAVRTVKPNYGDGHISIATYAQYRDAHFIATMHPGVALAVAEWLEVTVTWFDREAAFIKESQLKQFEDDWFTDERALAVADAILGGGE